MPIRIEPHALERMQERGVTTEEVERTLREGTLVPARQGRIEFRYTFENPGIYAGRQYQRKIVRVFVVEEEGNTVVITAIADYQRR